VTLDVMILLSLSLHLCFILGKTSINHKCVYTSQISISLDMILIRTPNIHEAHEFIHYAAVNETYKRHNNNQHNIPYQGIIILCANYRGKKISAISVQITSVRLYYVHWPVWNILYLCERRVAGWLSLLRLFFVFICVLNFIIF